MSASHDTVHCMLYAIQYTVHCTLYDTIHCTLHSRSSGTPTTGRSIRNLQPLLKSEPLFITLPTISLRAVITDVGCVCFRSVVGLKRASQGPILPVSGTIKRQRTADPVKNVSAMDQPHSCCDA